ncbi:MAG: membrane protein insertion efficiency factor YidD [Candidatus Helarchaeota archaeon]|nr:membrane protein insertion efficiency factor YidD [Candidatus Helarchaeota archaeon]
MKRLLIQMIRLYKQNISALLPFNHCRFYPSCSEYSLEAIEAYGVIPGLLLTAKRIVKCHPFSASGGYDPVP